MPLPRMPSPQLAQRAAKQYPTCRARPACWKAEAEDQDYLQHCPDTKPLSAAAHYPNRWRLRCAQVSGQSWFGGDAQRADGGVGNATPLHKDGDR
jgi:hypothetical protein